MVLKPLKTFALILVDYPCSNVTILGHASSDELDAQQLSEDRAVAIKNYLVQQGVASNRIEIELFGDVRPMISNDLKINQAFNRRVTFKTKPYPCPEKKKNLLEK